MKKIITYMLEGLKFLLLIIYKSMEFIVDCILKFILVSMILISLILFL